MKETKIKITLETIKKVQEFNKIVSTYDDEITILSHRYEINAKSIMGLFSINLLEPVTCVLYSDDEQVINNFIKDILLFECKEEADEV